MLIEAWKPIWGGGQVHVHELTARLIKNHGCKVDLFVMNLGGKRVEVNDGLRIFRVGEKTCFSMSSRLKWCSAVYRLVRIMHNNQPYDIIHAHANLPGLPAKMLSRKLDIPVVYTVHGCGLDAITAMYGRGMKSFFLYHFEKFLQTKIKYNCEISVDSSFLRFKNCNKVLKVIPNGVDVSRFDKVRVAKSRKFKIVFVGRFDKIKGVKYLIKSISLIPKQKRNFELHLIGFDYDEKALKKLSLNLGLENIIKFRDKIIGNKLIREYKSSHLFVLPSLSEGMPLTLLEAWAAKLPVIVTNVGESKYLIKDGKNGFIIKSKDSCILAKKILQVIHDYKKVRLFGINGYKTIRKGFSWEEVTQRTNEIYAEVIKCRK